MATLHEIPAVIHSRAATRRLEVDLFPRVLPHVADVQVARRAVERKTPRIAQAVRPDLGRIWPRAGFHIDPQQLAQQRGRILPATQRVAGAAAVACAGVEKTVRTES